jgi:hypothetical protein
VGMIGRSILPPSQALAYDARWLQPAKSGNSAREFAGRKVNI